MAEHKHHTSTASTEVISGPPSVVSSSPFGDEAAWRHDPFATPIPSHPASTASSTYNLSAVRPRRYFHSRRIVKGQADRPWLDRKDPREKWVTIIPIIGLVLGLCFTGFLIFQGFMSVENHVYCPVLDEDWSRWNPAVWTKEVEVGGFGNGQFEQTTNTDENAFIKDGALHIKPTLQDEKLITTDNVVDLLKDGMCSSTKWANCVTSTNTTNGTIVNPVKSARISTKVGAKIKYGRVEVVAQMPSGDWLWPAIWMLPVNETYGAWPASGEIDILESRGNNWTYAQGGNDIASSTLHWGPDAANDAWWMNNNKLQALRTTYSSKFNTFGLEWTEKYMFTYINSRLMQVMYVKFDKPFWQKTSFPPSNANGTRFVDQWTPTGDKSAPFNQDFYLILNVAVGGTNGWFQDGMSGKPWVDSSPYARKDFWQARNTWLPTWEKGGEMIVKSVKMWQQKGYNGCN